MIVSTFTQSTTGTKEQKSRDPLLTALRGGFPLFQVTPLDEEPLRAPLAGTNTSRDMSPGNPVPSSISNFPGPSKLFIDRKSTRLNSSHGYISYAVFCLKKKKKYKKED